MNIYIVIHIDTNDSDVNIADCFLYREKAEPFIDEIEKTQGVIDHIFCIEEVFCDPTNS